jgi:protein gp37
VAQNSTIEWTDATWNPIRGCTRVSPGCQNCYAERVAIRFSGKGQAYEGLAKITNGHPQWTGKIAFVEKHLLDPLKWKEPRRIFVNSMSDLFHEGVSDPQLDAIFAVMAQAHWHTFQVLTKRPERMLAYFQKLQAAADEHAPKTMTGIFLASDVLNIRNMARNPHSANAFEARWPLPNVWLGVSVENQKAADERIPLLLQTPAAVRWISAEPLLGPVDLANFVTCQCPGTGEHCQPCLSGGLNWLVAGGESGPGARPMHPEWARSLRDQCKAAGVPFFFKQWGQYAPGALNDKWDAVANDGSLDIDDPLLNVAQVTKVGKKAAGRKLDGVEHNEYPAVHSAEEAA